MICYKEKLKYVLHYVRETFKDYSVQYEIFDFFGLLSLIFRNVEESYSHLLYSYKHHVCFKKVEAYLTGRVIHKYHDVEYKYNHGQGFFMFSPKMSIETCPAVMFRNIENTIHPYENRLINIRENMELMGMPHDFDLAVDDIHAGKITRSEELHHTLHPCFYCEMVVGFRHTLHLYSQSRQHPCAMLWSQHTHTIATVVAMEIGSIEQMIAQMSHKQMLRIVAMERFSQEFVATNLTQQCLCHAHFHKGNHLPARRNYE